MASADFSTLQSLAKVDYRYKLTNDHILSLNENIQTLVSGFKMILDIVSKHEKLLNSKSKIQEKEDTIVYSELSDNESNIGANELIDDVSALSNIDLNDNFAVFINQLEPQLSSTVDKLKPKPSSMLEDLIFDDISNITSDLTDYIEPEFLDIKFQENTTPKNHSHTDINDIDSRDGCNGEDHVNNLPAVSCKVDQNIQADINSSIIDSDNDDGGNHREADSYSGDDDMSNDDVDSSQSSLYKGLKHHPYEAHHKGYFSFFKVNEMDKSTDFNVQFENRSVAYYGEYPYKYSNTTHQAQPFSNNIYLTKLLNYVEIVYPGAKFNSALIHRYSTGEMFIPMHSDSEADIADGSSILTISLGDSRKFEFEEKDSSYRSSLLLDHGDSHIMTKSSQEFFLHGIPVEEGKKLRISVTLRLVNCPKVAEQAERPCTQPKHVLSQQTTPTLQPPTSETGYRQAIQKARPVMRTLNKGDTINTIYISSSMFRFLSPQGLSSAQQRAHVFFYPGANSAQMLKRLLQDPEFQALDRNKVTQIFLLTGTNNVDSIFSATQTIPEVNESLSQMLYKLWMLFDAKINVLNILPREHSGKNLIVKRLNLFLYNECKAHGLNFLDTEHGNHPMFTVSNGIRNNYLFVEGFDNVHLNRSGYSVIARYLKRLAHMN